MQCTTELHSDKERTGIDFGWSAMAGFLKAIIQRSTSSPLWWWYKKMVVQGEKEKSCLLQCSGLALAILPLTEWQMRETRNHLFMWCRCRNESPERWSIQTKDTEKFNGRACTENRFPTSQSRSLQYIKLLLSLSQKTVFLPLPHLCQSQGNPTNTQVIH